ncbi:MAG: hypothetical protein Roseis2KO_06240 [Roseivirga sp.]
MLCLLAAFGFVFTACQESIEEAPLELEEASQAIKDQLAEAGYNPEDAFKWNFNGVDGYLVEYDIFFTEAEISGLTKNDKVLDTEHYRTTNLVTGTPRTIKVGIDPAFGSSAVTALNNTIAMYNAENINLTFQLTSVTVSGKGKKQTYNTDADILITAFRERPRRGFITLGIAAGFPTNAGDPADGFGLNTYWIDNLGPSVEEIKGVMAHEIGHTIGFRHTDYATRVSCGSNVNEGSAGVGAIYIPGTPTGSDTSSWMQACGPATTFNGNDVTALEFLY